MYIVHAIVSGTTQRMHVGTVRGAQVATRGLSARRRRMGEHTVHRTTEARNESYP